MITNAKQEQRRATWKRKKRPKFTLKRTHWAIPTYYMYVYNIYTLVNLKLSGEKQFLNINQLNGGIVVYMFCRYLCMVAICRQGQPSIDKQYESNHIELQVENEGKSRVSNLKVMQIGLWPWPNENATRFAACESCDTRPEWQNNCVRRVYNLQRATKIKV